MIYNLYKQRGETPLECIDRFRDKNPDLQEDKMTYMGRLDPLAEGVLLVASDKDIKRKEEFLGLDKKYDFTALFGFVTDTYDVMGKITKITDFSKGYVAPKDMDLIKIAKIYEGEREQKYPEYSSKIIAAKRKNQKQNFDSSNHSNDFPPLLHLGEGPSEARGGEVKKITVYKLQFHKLETLNNKELFGRLLMDISKVKGDFRQQEILNLWKQILLDSKNPQSYFLAHFSAHVSSGTYIRSLVNDMGNTLGCGATTLSIIRTQVGDYKIEDSIK